MDPFPEEYELIAFFEAEPKLTDEGVPWCYNRLTFETRRNGDTVICSLEPGNKAIDLEWRHAEKEVASFELRDVASLKIMAKPGEEFMVASFGNREINDFFLFLKPFPKVRWGSMGAVNA